MSEENVFDNIQGVTYHFSKEGLLEDWREEALRHREEIERLNNRVKQLEKSIMISNKKHSFMTKDNIKLRTIINELEKYIKESCWKDDWGVESIYVKTLLNKLQELKGDDSNEKI